MSSALKTPLAFCAFVFFCLFAGLSFVQQSPFSPALQFNREAEQFRAPKQNIWADLSPSEAKEVVDFLWAQPKLNLTQSSKATSFDNRIVSIEVLQPNKTDVLRYLDDSSKLPPRWAQVVIAEGAHEIATLANYMVGPLPASESTQILPLSFCFSSGRHDIVNPLPSNLDFEKFTFAVGNNISDIIKELLGGDLNLRGPGGIQIGGRTSKISDTRIITWVQFYRTGGLSDATSILPQGLYIKTEINSRDTRDWRITQWYYNGILYDSVADLRAAMRSPGFLKSPLAKDGPWTDTEDFHSQIPGRELPPPIVVQPNGNRFNIDHKQRYISWLGYEFYITSSTWAGLSLHNIRFHGESIIYELGLQEALSHYAGGDPIQGGLQFLDTFFGMGARSFELVPGYDCPAYATFLSTEYHTGDEPVKNRNSICIFEYVADHAFQRHTSDVQVSVTRNTYLVVRSVSTVGNYDYTIDYIFYIDGTVEVKLRASGFIFGAFWAPNIGKKDEYGYKVHDALSTSMHDHVLNFKADMDIGTISNTLVRVAVEPTAVDQTWEDDHSTPRNTMHLVHYIVDKETGIDWPQNAGEMYIVFDQNSTNSWGEIRGYRIVPGTGVAAPSHLTIHNSTYLGKAAEWASRDLWVVKHKDSEPKSANPMNFIDGENPLVDFSLFVDDDDIVQNDLVIYFNLGNHHVPHSGDIPNTVMHTSASSIMLTPFNFHDSNPGLRTAQGVKIELTPDGSKVSYFGGRHEKGVALAMGDMEPDVSDYSHGPVPWVKSRCEWLMGRWD